MSSADFTSKTVKQRMTQSTGKKLNLKPAEKARVDLTAEQQKQIRKLYKDASAEVIEKWKSTPKMGSAILERQYLYGLANQLNLEVRRINQEIEGMIETNMGYMTSYVVEQNKRFLDAVGMPSGGAFSQVPDQVVRAVATGQIYEGNWSLSKAIWKSTKKTQADIQTVIAKGIAEQKGSYDIAKDLEKYLNPDAVKDWDWSKVYPGTARKVDFNAQRLARTMVSHAYQQAFVQTTQKNPFVTKYKWLSSGGERMCEICEERNGKLYDKDDLPIDHPMGMCTFEAVIPDSMMDISNRIADWENGEPNPELDEWARFMGYELSDTAGNPKEIPPDTEWVEMLQKASDYGGAQFRDTMLDLEKEIFKSLSPEEIQSITTYTGGSYKPMNAYLRYLAAGVREEQARIKSDIDEYQLRALRSVQSTLQKIKLTQPMILRRGARLDDLAGLLTSPDKSFSEAQEEIRHLSAIGLNEKFKGFEGQFAGFLSTSSDWRKGFGGNVEWIIYAPEGTEACSIMSKSQFGTREGETLVNAGTRIKIHKVVDSDYHKSSEIRIFAEIIP